MTREIFLVRHGQTVWNLEKRFQGWQDSPLTATGREQAATVGRILAHHLRSRADVALMVSPLGRARETAALLGTLVPALGPAKICPKLTEIGLGHWEGLTRCEVKRGWGALLEGVPRPEWYFHAPGGEALASVQIRARAWLAQTEGTVVAVSHSVVGRLIRGLALGLSPSTAAALPAPQDAVWRLADGRIDLLIHQAQTF